MTQNTLLINNDYHQQLKQLMKSYNISDWDEALSEQSFIDFLSTYQDDEANNIYHLLFKPAKTQIDKLMNAANIAKMCAEKGISIARRNNAGKLPSEVAEGKTYFAPMLSRYEEQEIAKAKYGYDDEFND